MYYISLSTLCGFGVVFLENLNLHVHGCSPFCILLELLNVGGLDRQGMRHGCWEQIYAGFWFENLKDRDQLEYTSIYMQV
jgi:hypothetical protein